MCLYSITVYAMSILKSHLIFMLCVFCVSNLERTFHDALICEKCRKINWDVLKLSGQSYSSTVHLSHSCFRSSIIVSSICQQHTMARHLTIFLLFWRSLRVNTITLISIWYILVDVLLLWRDILTKVIHIKESI